MTEKEFIEETSNIEKFYGKELNQFENSRWFQELKNIDTTRYRQIIRQVFRKCKFMPKLADIISIQDELPYGQAKTNLFEKVECSKCKGFGILFYTKIVDNGDRKLRYEYVARCDCQNGLNYSYDGTKIADKEHRTKFYVPTAQQIGI